MGQLTSAQRVKILLDYHELHSLRRVAELHGVAVGTVRKWVKRQQSGGNMDNLPKSGRPSLMSTEASRLAVEGLLATTNSTPKGVATSLHAAGLTLTVVSRSTLIRAAKTYAAAEGHPIDAQNRWPKKALTQHTMSQRLSWANKYKNLNWSSVMFTDRKRFEFKYPGQRVTRFKWVRKGSKHEQYKVNHAQGLNIYAGITPYGMTVAHIVTGTSQHKTTFKNKKGEPARNITAQEYQHVMNNTLLPQGKLLFTRQGQASWYFQQDNDPTHKAGPGHVAAWNAKQRSSVQFMTWPPNSPDLSPIENIWAIVDGKVQAKGCSTFQEFKDAVLHELKSVPLSTLKDL
jgi:hypothetical protein